MNKNKKRFNEKQAIELTKAICDAYISENGTNMLWLASGVTPHDHPIPKGFEGTFQHVFSKYFREKFFSVFPSSSYTTVAFYNNKVNSLISKKFRRGGIRFDSNNTFEVWLQPQ